MYKLMVIKDNENENSNLPEDAYVLGEFSDEHDLIELYQNAKLEKKMELEEFKSAFDINSDIDNIIKNEKIEKARMQEYLKESIPHMRGRYFFSLLSGCEQISEIREKMEFYEFNIPESNFVIVVIEIDNYHKHFRNNLSENGFLLLKSILELASNIFKNDTFFYHNINDSVIGICERDDIYKKIKQLGKAFSKRNKLTLSAGISSTGSDITEILYKRDEAMHAVRQRVFLGNESIIYYEDIMEFSSNNSENYIWDIDKVINIILNKERIDVEEEIDRIFAKFQNTMVEDDEYVNKMCLEILFALEKILGNYKITVNKFLTTQGRSIFDIISYVDSITQKKEWLIENIFDFKSFVTQEKESNMNTIIRVAVDYIENNYMNNSISLEEVSGVVGKNPAYLCNLFKLETGKNFAKYITEQRISKGKELLGNVNYKIYEIAESLGYVDDSHFTKIFKKHVGIKPSEYRKLILNNKYSGKDSTL